VVLARVLDEHASLLDEGIDAPSAGEAASAGTVHDFADARGGAGPRGLLTTTAPGA
jgi:hypothetical protein